MQPITLPLGCTNTVMHVYRIVREVNVGSFGFNDVTSMICVCSYVMMENCQRNSVALIARIDHLQGKAMVSKRTEFLLYEFTWIMIIDECNTVT